MGREGAWKLDLGVADTRAFYPGSSSWLKGLVSDDSKLPMEAVLSRSSQAEALSAVLQLRNCFSGRQSDEALSFRSLCASYSSAQLF